MTAVVLATDNVISGDAYVPGDIVGSMAGKTIEIHSTDAEGRLTLADAVYYSIKHEGVSEVVDVATLTGACVVALGEFNTGAFTNSKELYGKIEKAAEEAGEPMWQLPLSKGYRDLIKGDRGDLKNTGGKMGRSKYCRSLHRSLLWKIRHGCIWILQELQTLLQQEDICPRVPQECL